MNNNNRNNNNNNNNRRRGRGNNRQGNGGQPINRIDSRARGNAPQMLEKYRKLAHDAHLNGDRVSEESYLQFADHYFRVIADARVRQEDGRQRGNDRWQDGGDTERSDSYGNDGDDQGEYGAGYGYSDDRAQGNGPVDSGGQRDRAPRVDTRDAPRLDTRVDARQDTRAGPRSDQASEAAQPMRERPEVASEDESEPPAFEPVENPFLRDNRSRGLRQRRPRGEPRMASGSETADRGDGETGTDETRSAESGVDEARAFDASILPPAIAAPREDFSEDAPTDAEAADAKPRRRARRPRSPAGDADEALQAVS